MAVTKSSMRKINMLAFCLVPTIVPLLVLSYLIMMFGEDVEWYIAMFFAIAPIYLFFYFFVIPYSKSKVMLSRMGYTCTNREAFRFFYAGWSFTIIPGYEEVSHHPEFTSNSASSLISYLEYKEWAIQPDLPAKKAEVSHRLFFEVFRKHPKNLHITILLALEISLAIFIPVIFAIIDIFISLQPNTQSMGYFTIIGPISPLVTVIAIFLLPDYLGKRKLRRMGYNKTFQANAIIFFYTGSYFLPLPRHEEIATLPDFEEDNIYSLIDIQIRMYEAKKG